MHISKQVNRKEEQIGKPNPDRNTQFEFIVKKQREYLAAGDPLISVDTKKKENIGNFKATPHSCKEKKKVV